MGNKVLSLQPSASGPGLNPGLFAEEKKLSRFYITLPVYNTFLIFVPVLIINMMKLKGNKSSCTFFALLPLETGRYFPRPVLCDIYSLRVKPVVTNEPPGQHRKTHKSG
jgi:hypothetical protein